MLQISQLSYSIDGKKILSDISFTLSEGDFAGLMGPNGSGKTTVIRALSGVIRGYDGVLSLSGRDLKTYPRKEAARLIAVVPQEAHFPFPFTVREIVLMGRAPHQKQWAFDSIEDVKIASLAMDEADCAQFAERAIDTLSGGEKQR
ncbi:MAG: ABC transporter ATP-binding protein, partial [Deltaproteobacteria bacterium]|nr:ABC transporter ATP-binding protein [Deltaproteobacteria bacterium]